MIPRIIHQTWKTRDVPQQFLFFQKTWQIHHPSWKYRLWTDEDARELVSRHYPAFLGVYDAYENPICRVDAFRYLVLKQYGGVYADLDFECLRPLDTLLEDEDVVLGLEPASHVAMHWQAARLNQIVCNAFMASTANHPFWDHVIARLIESSRYAGPLDATGPFLLTRALDGYPYRPAVSVLPSELIYPADTWDCGDGRLFDLAHWHGRTARAYAIHHWSGTWYRDEVIEQALPSAQASVKLLENGRPSADTILHAREVAPARQPLVLALTLIHLGIPELFHEAYASLSRIDDTGERIGAMPLPISQGRRRAGGWTQPAESDRIRAHRN